MIDANFEDMMPATLKAIGVGGGGGNAINHMIFKYPDNDSGIDFITANTDVQALKQAGGRRLQLGQEITKGLGAGANPEVGKAAAEESEASIRQHLEGADMVFVTAGMGGGTGSGGAPVIARIAKEMGILTVAVVTRPFPFEGPQRQRLAAEAIKNLSEHVDSLITIPNERLLKVLGKNATLLTAFEAANDVLRDAVMGISEMITAPGMINVDFADVRTVMSCQGFAKIGTGVGVGENRAADAAIAAINSPLLEDIEVTGAEGLLVNISAGLDLSIGEFNEVGDALRDYVSDEATVVIGTSIDMERTDEIKVSVVATGLGKVGNGAPVSESTRQAPQRNIGQGSQPRNTSGGPASAQAGRYGRPSPNANHGHARTEKPTQTAHAAPNSEEDMLDIPAFLRRPVRKSG